MAPVLPSSGILAVGLLCLLLLGSGCYAAWHWFARGQLVDLLYGITAVVAVVFLLFSISSGHPGIPHASGWPRLSYQFAVSMSTLFLLYCAGTFSREVICVAGVQGLFGAALVVVAGRVESFRRAEFETPWLIWNGALMLLLILIATRSLMRKPTENAAPVMVVILMGAAIFLQDALHLQEIAVPVSVFHLLFAGGLIGLWLFVTGRAFRSLGAGGVQEKAIQGERRRIAQDLHDGVASQLVHLIASLNIHGNEQRAIVLALEQCLLDMKLLVDNIANDPDNGNVVALLANARYRVQHVLQRLHIELEWQMDDTQTLQRLKGLRAMHVLRIFQEALANMIQHSQATCVQVRCCHEPAHDCLLLEIRDNGVGLQPCSGVTNPPGGKGMTGMQLRAELLGGTLLFEKNHPQGTCVRLQVPVQSPEPKPRLQ